MVLSFLDIPRLTLEKYLEKLTFPFHLTKYKLGDAIHFHWHAWQAITSYFMAFYGGFLIVVKDT